MVHGLHLGRLRAMERHLAPSGVATNVVEPSPSTGPKLLSDTEMMDYLREGYCAFQLDDLPAEYHAGIVERLDNVIEKHGNPGNNMLPMVPELTQMLEHPLIDGALQSILGTDYYVHLHRHVHNRPNIDEGEPGAVQRLHKE